MNYSDLKEIIKHIRRAVNCNNCQTKFENEDLQIVTTFQNEGLFYLDCHNCRNQLLVHVAIVNKNEKSTLNIQARSGKKVSQNEILDMHNFLGQFNGDFKKLFSI